MKIKKSILALALAITCTGFAFASETTTVIPLNEGNDRVVESALATSYSAESPCQITFSARIPEGFDLDCYATIMNLDSGVEYEIPMMRINDYTEVVFVPEGTYRVGQIAVYDDNTGKYPFNNVDDFVVAAGDAKNIHCSFVYEEDVKNEIIAKKSAIENANSQEIEHSTTYTSAYEVFHTGKGTGQMYVVGEATGAYSIIVTITQDGTLGTATFNFDVEGDKKDPVPVDIPLSGTQKAASLGISLYFEGDFCEGDTYTFKTPDPQKIITIRNVGNSNGAIDIVPLDANTSAYDIIVSKNYDILIEIRKTGGMGTAVFAYSLDGGRTYSSEEYIPLNGTFEIANTELAITFDAATATDFVADDIYTIQITKPKSANYFFVFLLVGVAAFILYYADAYLKSQKLRDSDFVLHPYTPLNKEKNK